MVRSELIRLVRRRYPQYADRAKDMVGSIFDEMSETLVSGGRVEIRGFGSFGVKTRNPRRARNPKTGERIDVPAKQVPYFKCGKDLRERMNSEDRLE